MRVVVFTAVALVLVACGGAAPPAATPERSERASEAAAAPEPATVEEAQAQIADAERTLRAPSASPATNSTPPKTTTEAPHDTVKEQANECRSSCRAIASMRRAVNALCRIAGDSDARCTEAKQKLEQNESRVVTCGC